MGRRTRFFYSNDLFSLKELVIYNYGDFRRWFLKAYRKSQEREGVFSFDFSSTETDPLIQFVAINQLTSNINSIDQKYLDRTIAVFVGSYCNWGRGKKCLTQIDDIRNDEYYLLEPTLDKKATTLWNYLIFGRSLRQDNRFINSDDSFLCRNTKIGFLTSSELNYLSNSLNSPLLEDFRKKETVQRMLEIFSKGRIFTKGKTGIIFEIE